MKHVLQGKRSVSPSH